MFAGKLFVKIFIINIFSDKEVIIKFWEPTSDMIHFGGGLRSLSAFVFRLVMALWSGHGKSFCYLDHQRILE